MAITATQVKELREKTGVGMMQCKAALAETDGDLEKAIELLRKRGEAVAAKRADREANEGCVFIDESNAVVLAEINCETDFVTGSEDFQKLGADVVAAIQANDVADLEALLQVNAGSLPVAERLKEIVAKIGENIGIKRFVKLTAGDSEAIATYSHMKGRIGVAVKVSFSGTPSDSAALKAVVKDVCMQAAATSPLGVSSVDVDSSLIEKEKDIYRDQALAEGKPAEIVERMIEGRVNKYFKEVCLEEQMFVKDNKKSIKQYLADSAKSLGISDLKITHMTRMELGK
jgi:elongation factor Ts